MMNLNSPASKVGSLIRYSVYFLFYGLILLNIPSFIKCILCFIILSFYIQRFNKEKIYFKRTIHSPYLGNYGFLFFMTIFITISQICIFYLQMKKVIPLSQIQIAYRKKESIWLIITILVILIPTLQIYLTNGFFFNYYFRKQTVSTALLGIISSGLFYGLLNWNNSLIYLGINSLYGIIYAYSYLRTERITVPIYFAIITNLFMIFTL